MSANGTDIPGDTTPPETPHDKRRQCPNCGAMADRLAVHCPECKAELPAFGHTRRSSRGRRYVYGKRKTQLSQEAIWLIVVIIIGLLIVFGVQVIAFMRSKKLMMAPPMPKQMIAGTLEHRPRVSPPVKSKSIPQLPSLMHSPKVHSQLAFGHEYPPLKRPLT